MNITAEKYTRNPIQVEAVQFDGSQEGADRLMTFYLERSIETMQAALQNGGKLGNIGRYDAEIGFLSFPTPAGPREVLTGEWLVYEDSKFKVYTDEAFRKAFAQE